MSDTNITPESLNVFLMYARDAKEWGGNPWVTQGNVTLTKAQRGNLTQCIIAGLLTVCDDGEDCQYVSFTKEGEALALTHGVEIY